MTTVASTKTSPAEMKRRGWVSGARWAGAGLVDQVIVAITNSGNTLLAGALLTRERASTVMLAAAFAYFAIGINRAFVGEVLLSLASRYEGKDRDTLVRDGLMSAAVAGILSSVIFVVIWLIAPHGHLRDLIYLVPFMPLILLHDTGRFTYLADRKPQNALVVDSVWIVVQITVIIASLVTFGPTAMGLLGAWGCGATLGFFAFMVRERITFWRSDPRQWIERTRRLSGWFTATALVGQVQTLFVTSVTGGLSPTAVSGLRTAQTVLLQPVQNFQLAVQGLLIPRLSRIADRAAKISSDKNELSEAYGSQATMELTGKVRRISLIFTGLGIIAVIILWPVASLALTHIKKFSDIAPLALPLSLQSGIYLIQVPFTAALRGMQRSQMIFIQYVIFSVTSLAGFLVGVWQRSLTGAVWGLAIGSSVGLIVMIALYIRAIRELHAETTPSPIA